MPAPHQVLGISSTASVEEAEDAYHRLMRREHPDLHHGAGPDRVAQAERRTQELNAAISAIRSGASARAGAAAGARHEPHGDAPPGAADAAGWADGARGGTGGDPARDRGAGTAWDRGTADAGGTGWGDPDWSDAPRTAPCPWCGRQFASPVALKDHVFDDHDLRLDRRERSSLLGGRLRRLLRTGSHFPLWAVIPVNALIATVIGVLATAATDDLLGWWAAGIAMAPTAVVLIDRLGDLEL